MRWVYSNKHYPFLLHQGVYPTTFHNQIRPHFAIRFLPIRLAFADTTAIDTIHPPPHNGVACPIADAPASRCEMRLYPIPMKNNAELRSRIPLNWESQENPP